MALAGKNIRVFEFVLASVADRRINFAQSKLKVDLKEFLLELTLPSLRTLT